MLLLRARDAITTPPANTPLIQDVLTSDSFSGGDVANIIGRAVDLYAGGTAVSWAGVNDADGNTLAIEDGKLIRPGAASASTSWGVGVAMSVPDYELSFVVVALPVGNPMWADVRRASAGGIGHNGYRIRIEPFPGTIRAQKRTTETGLVDLSTTFPIQAGDRVAVGITGTTLYIARNGTVLWTGTETDLAGPGFASFVGTGLVSAFTVDDLLIRTPAIGA